MDLHLYGRNALVCGASKGLGFACAMSLAREGVNVTLAARNITMLTVAAEAIRTATGNAVSIVAGDITTVEGRNAALECSGMPDILVTNCGGPAPGYFHDWTREDWMRALNANMYAPIALTQAVINPMIERRYGRIVNITSAAVKMPNDALGLSNGARSGLTGFMAGLARQVIEFNVTINNLLPGSFQTDRLQSNMDRESRASGAAIDDIVAARVQAIPAKRFGRPSELGDACTYLCSAQAGYITGQNVLMDGGVYPGVF